MKSNLSRWGLSRYYITKGGILYFKTLNKGWVKKPFRLLESKKRKKYTQSLLNDEGKYVYGYLHRLVAMAYIPNPNNYPMVRHLNDNPLDNRLANLAWGTQKDNVKDSIKNNSFHFLEHPSGPNHPNYNKPPHNKLSLRKERRVLRLYYKGLNIKDIQLRLRLKSSTSIRRILKNRSLLK